MNSKLLNILFHAPIRAIVQPNPIPFCIFRTLFRSDSSSFLSVL